MNQVPLPPQVSSPASLLRRLREWLRALRGRRLLTVGSGLVLALAIVGVSYLARADRIDGTDGPGTTTEVAGTAQMTSTTSAASAAAAEEPTAQERRFAANGFATDLAMASVDLDLILSGGPGKDGIPALTEPVFVPPTAANLDDDVIGILVDFNGERRFYPLSILVWHEMVNDTIGDTHFLVTFCPLCGSGIVFDRDVEGEVLDFGVSGFLYESNLVMFDRKTESLWSQSRGEAIVGSHLGTRLDILPMQQLSFQEARQKYPDMRVLSDDTGYQRDYSRNPYSGYEESDSLMFPVSVQDEQFFAKDLMYVFWLEDTSVAFPLDRLLEGGASTVLENTAVEAARDGGEITVTLDGIPVPGYIEMWFSWATQHQGDGVVWDME